MRKRRNGFTLVELLIVMGIIILIVTMAIPSIRVLTGSRSLSVSQNQLAAVLTRAREDAIALQDIRGVLFYLDPGSGRVGALIVQRAVITDPQDMLFNTVVLDSLPGNDSLLLPTGIRVQTVFTGMNGAPAPTNESTHAYQLALGTAAQLSATQQDDRYLGFNPISPSAFVRNSPLQPANVQFYVGGCILFDGNGRLLVRPYAFQMTQYNSSGMGAPSNLCHFMGFDIDSGNNLTFSATSTPTKPRGNFNYNVGSIASPVNSIIYMPGLPNTTPGASSIQYPIAPVLSQIGLVLFDYDVFKTLGFTDVDADVSGSLGSGSTTYTSAWPTSNIGFGVGASGGDGIHTEADEENWIDSNSTPIMINRYNGTLIRGE